MADPKAQESDADAGSPELLSAPKNEQSAPKNEQFAGLNKLRRERTWVDVFLIGGTCLHGQIRSFDASMMLLQTRSGDIGLYHHAISTVVRAQKRGGGKTFKPRAPQQANPVYPADPADLPDPPRRAPDKAPVVIVKQRRARTMIKPQ